MKTKKTAMLMGSFIGDALALGAHWVYNTDVIDKKFGSTIDRYQNPLTSYHTGKTAGDFTHYGDQMLVLLETTAEPAGYEPGRFAENWRRFFRDYGGYFDKATKTTLDNMASSENPAACGSASDDLAGASRVAPLIYRYVDAPDQLEHCVRSQTAVTHNNDLVIASALFASQVGAAVLGGAAPANAVDRVLGSGAFPEELTEPVRKGLDSRGRDTRETIGAFGRMCSAQAALPGSIHLIVTYENDFKRALLENVLAGGDSAARGLLVGMVLGAHLGMEAIPDRWKNELTARDRILGLAGAIDAQQAS